MEAPPEAFNAAAHWAQLSEWERAELGRRLRRDGWTCGESMDVLPVGKGTLAGWCKEIRLSDEQIEAIKARRPSGVGTGIPVDTQRPSQASRHRASQEQTPAGRFQCSNEEKHRRLVARDGMDRMSCQWGSLVQL
jgi:hypothetical protein